MAGLLGVIVAGFFVARWGRPSVIVVTATQSFALLAQWAFAEDAVAAVAATAAASFALSGMTAVLGTRMLEVAPGSTDMASAGTSTAFNVGITAGALVGSLLLAGAGVRSTALVGALLTVVAFGCVLAEPLVASKRATPVRSGAR